MDETIDRTFRVGHVLGQGTALYLSRFGSFTAVAAILMAPSVLISVFLIPAGRDWQTVAGRIGILLPLDLILATMTATAIAFGASRVLHGETAGIGECFGRMFARLHAVIVIAFFFWPAVAIAFACLIFPIFIIMRMLWLAPPATAIDRTGPMESLSRSMELTDDNSGGVTAVLAIIVGVRIVTWLVLFGLWYALDSLGSGWWFAALAVLDGVIAAIFNAWVGGVSASAYHELVRIHRRLDGVEDVAKVFD